MLEMMATHYIGCSSANTLKKVRDFFGSLCIVVMGRCPHEKTKELESTLSKQKL